MTKATIADALCAFTGTIAGNDFARTRAQLSVNAPILPHVIAFAYEF